MGIVLDLQVRTRISKVVRAAMTTFRACADCNANFSLCYELFLFSNDFPIYNIIHNIYKIGAEALAITLKEVNNFTFVSLEWNQIGSIGVNYLAEALTFNTNLLHLDLRNNNIGDDGAISLVSALSSNDTLKTLDLRWNQVSQK